ncbi:ATP-dependent acyl-CoA ligase [Achromobacter spanius]|uniref:ATP-dependent acyl-CoA ligase n=1 Tax=Achromobacter spanius TaxID=217203 RepID=A0A2S5GXB2_9BURK|nr:AMP-binding protein [Achromobacter spanius]PPA77616.1 ATP-dependent acyl-CoA ligase [Achromobacter spanius]
MNDDVRAAIPDRQACVLRYLLEAQAEKIPDRIFVRFHGGPTWTYAQTLARVQQRAVTLRREGVKQGDRVLCWMGNGPELLTSWFAINYLGAVYVPLNTGLRGRPLAHVLDNAQASLMVAHRALAGRLHDVAPGALTRVLLTGEEPRDAPLQPPAGVSFAPLSDAADAPPPALLALDAPIEPWDMQSIMYTSGTTGLSKGVVTSYVQIYTMGPDAFDWITPDDRCMIAGPIFHCGSTLYVYAMLAYGGSIAMVPEFRTDQFWDAIRDTESTVVLLLGVMANFLLKQAPSPRDREHRLRGVFIVPFGEDAPAFQARFGVDLYTVYNMTEIASPLSAGPGLTEAGRCGKPRPWFELRVGDAQDRAVPDGTVGELLIRSHRPWALFSGYYRNPEATAASMRNGWFHTGDAFRRDADGTFFFVDRLKDVIRRRGENISSFELEGELCAHPDVREAVAVAVPSVHSEDEVLAVVTAVDGARVDEAALIAWLAERVPHYMVPRYVRVVDDLPKTASGKLQKHVLRSEGLADGTWDREAAGIKLRRERLA